MLLAIGRHREILWAGTECCWQEDDTECYCGLVQIVADSRTTQRGTVGWYRVLLAGGRHRVELWAGTECCLE